MKRKIPFAPHPYLFLALFLAITGFMFFKQEIVASLPFIQKKEITKPIPVDAIDFTSTLEEAGNIDNSKSQNWWLNSGGLVYNTNSTFKSIQGNLEPNNRWFSAYLKANPRDTDGGLHPQNILRLVNKNNVQNTVQEAYFKINKTNMSKSTNRNESNGVLFFNRYIDGDNLYYTGIRVDGTSIIKKKKNGIYHTMNQKKIYEGTFNRDSKPNLIPENKWIGLRSEVKNLNFKDVSIKVYLDKSGYGNWELIAEAIDNGSTYDGSSFINAGHPGIRTDFIDIEFKNYSLKNI